METKHLDTEQYAMLYDALSNVYAVEQGESDRAGEHAELMFALKVLGINVYSSREAIRTAEELLNVN